MSILVVYDTMIFLQEAARPGRTHASFRAVHEGQVTLCLSPELLAEVQDVLSRDTVRARFPALTTEAVKAFITQVLARGVLFERVPHVFTWPQHPDDDHVFNLAIHAKAKYLVTWETRLLKLFTEMPPAAELLRRLNAEVRIITPKTLADVLAPRLDQQV